MCCVLFLTVSFIHQKTNMKNKVNRNSRVRITLNIDSEYVAYIGEGINFGDAAMILLNKVIDEFSVESLRDGVLFLALGKLQDDLMVRHTNFENELENFTLTMTEIPLQEAKV